MKIKYNRLKGRYIKLIRCCHIIGVDEVFYTYYHINGYYTLIRKFKDDKTTVVHDTYKYFVHGLKIEDVIKIIDDEFNEEKYDIIVYDKGNKI